MLSSDSPIRTQVLPAIWKGYTLPRSVIMGEKLPFEGMISTEEKVPQEWLDQMMNTFQNGSLADFYNKYLPHTLTERNHEQILLKANSILTEGFKELTPSDDRLLTIAAADLAHNADEYGHHLFQTACFLNEQNQLPKEARVVLGRKINPSLYKERELFETVEKALEEPTRKIPHKWAQIAFYNWMKHNDSDEYRAHMQRIVELEFISAHFGTLPLERAVRNYIHEHQEHRYKHRTYTRRRSWRPYGE